MKKYLLATAIFFFIGCGISNIEEPKQFAQVSLTYLRGLEVRQLDQNDMPSLD